MRLKLFFLVVTIVASSLSFGQKKSCAYKFHSVNSLSFLNGENEVSAALQSVNGIQKGNGFAGVGVGLDYYLYRTVPLFADVRYEFGKSKDKFFAYVDAGINFVWVRENDSDGPIFIWEGPNSSTKYHDGVYMDAGIGYFIAMKNAGGLAFSLGFSHKSLEKTVTYQDWRTQQPVTDTYNYNLNRIAIKVGWRF